jgi:hypothetical protein
MAYILFIGFMRLSTHFVLRILSDRQHVETFLDSRSREKYVYKSEMELLLKVKYHVACKGINDIQI